MSSSVVVITGASRGIGRAIALVIADEVKQRTPTLPLPLHMVLIARSGESLRETSRLVYQRCGSGTEDTSSDTVKISCHEVDLSDLDTLPETLEQILEPLSVKSCDSALLINNAGSLGPLGSSSSTSLSFSELRTAIDLNLTSSIWISSQFTRTFKASPLIRIVNISSICAIEPFRTMAIYCAGKAGRDMYHSVLAKENSPNIEKNQNKKDRNSKEGAQTLKVLNYAPGPCDTQMTDDLAECSVLDDAVHEFVSTSKKENKLVRVEDTAKKLFQILILDEYESGSHIDYYDNCED